MGRAMTYGRPTSYTRRNATKVVVLAVLIIALLATAVLVLGFLIAALLTPATA